MDVSEAAKRGSEQTEDKNQHNDNVAVPTTTVDHINCLDVEGRLKHAGNEQQHLTSELVC